MRNLIEIEGHIIQTSKLNTTIHNNKILNLVVAHQTITNGVPKLDTFNVVAFNGLALYILAMIKHKSHVSITGELKKRHHQVEIVTHQITFK